MWICTTTKASRKPPKTTQNCSENVWSEIHVCFCLVLPQFLFVCLFFVLTPKKTIKSRVFGYMDKIMELKISLHGQEESKAKSIKKQKTT